MNPDPRVMEFYPASLSRLESEHSAARIRAQLAREPFGLWAVEVLGEATFIGYVGLARPLFTAHFTPCVEIGWRLAYSWWGRGYATEAARRHYALLESNREVDSAIAAFAGSVLH